MPWQRFKLFKNWVFCTSEIYTLRYSFLLQLQKFKIWDWIHQRHSVVCIYMANMAAQISRDFDKVNLNSFLGKFLVRIKWNILSKCMHKFKVRIKWKFNSAVFELTVSNGRRQRGLFNLPTICQMELQNIIDKILRPQWHCGDEEH